MLLQVLLVYNAFLNYGRPGRRKERIGSKSKGLVPLWPTERQYLLKWAVIRIWGNWLSIGNPVLRNRKEPEMDATYFYCLTSQSWYRAGSVRNCSANIRWINYQKSTISALVTVHFTPFRDERDAVWLFLYHLCGLTIPFQFIPRA